MGLDGLGRGTVPRLAASTFRTCVVARATVPGTCRFELGVDEQDVEFVDFVDDLSALVDHDIPLYLVILSSIIAHSVG